MGFDGVYLLRKAIVLQHWENVGADDFDGPYCGDPR